MATIKELRERTPKGYNLAMVVPAHYDVRGAVEDFITDKAVPVLKEAAGALGVLRALDLPGKMQGIQKSMAMDGEEHRLLHLVLNPEPEPPVIMDYRFILHREEPYASH
jgi:hypothetical protein